MSPSTLRRHCSFNLFSSHNRLHRIFWRPRRLGLLLPPRERTTSLVAAMSTATRLVLILPVLAFVYRFWALGFSITGWTENDIPDLAGKVRFLAHSSARLHLSLHLPHIPDPPPAGGLREFSTHELSPDLQVAIVTGANMGLGFETARQLAWHGAAVVLGCRSASKCKEARLRIVADHPDSDVAALHLDLSEPASVKAFAEQVKTRYSTLDFLINNAGIMGTSSVRNSRSWDLQFATNHLGHFMLTGYLMDLLKRSKGRVVNHSSGCASQLVLRLMQFASAHPGAKLAPTVNLTDWNWRDRQYCPWAAYSQSKRANLYFTAELNRRFGDDGVSATSCHPGGSATGLQGKVDSETSLMVDMLTSTAFARLLYSQPKDGALPQTYAAVVAPPDSLVGPVWFANGAPTVQGSSMLNVLSFCDMLAKLFAETLLALAHPWSTPRRSESWEAAGYSYSASEARALWEESVRVTGVAY